MPEPLDVKGKDLECIVERLYSLIIQYHRSFIEPLTLSKVLGAGSPIKKHMVLEPIDRRKLNAAQWHDVWKALTSDKYPLLVHVQGTYGDNRAYKIDNARLLEYKKAQRKEPDVVVKEVHIPVGGPHHVVVDGINMFPEGGSTVGVEGQFSIEVESEEGVEITLPSGRKNLNITFNSKEAKEGE